MEGETPQERKRRKEKEWRLSHPQTPEQKARQSARRLAWQRAHKSEKGQAKAQRKLVTLEKQFSMHTNSWRLCIVLEQVDIGDMGINLYRLICSNHDIVEGTSKTPIGEGETVWLDKHGECWISESVPVFYRAEWIRVIDARHWWMHGESSYSYQMGMAELLRVDDD